jgi:hypothetical protein
MSDDDDDLLILNGARYWKQARWSRDKKVTVRTAARHRELGLPWLDWGGEVYIPEADGDAYIAGRLKRRNQRRRRQAITADTAEIGAA